MPPRLFSRYQFCVGYIDPTSGLLTLTDRDPFRFAPFPDNIQHAVRNGDSLFSLAQRYYATMSQAAQLWWVIADFQPDPILDPTIQLEIGRILQIPSLKTVQTEIFDSHRQQTSAT